MAFTERTARLRRAFGLICGAFLSGLLESPSFACSILMSPPSAISGALQNGAHIAFMLAVGDAVSTGMLNLGILSVIAE